MTAKSRTAWTFAVTSAALFMASLDNLVVTTALPSIRAHLHASPQGLQWTVNAYTLTFAVLLLQMQAYAACDDPDIRAAARTGYKELWALVERLTGLPYERIVTFFAMGMLMNVAAAMDLPAVDERWTSWCPKQPAMSARPDGQ